MDTVVTVNDIPNHVICEVARGLSSRPRNPHWARYISLADLVNALQGEGFLGRIGAFLQSNPPALSWHSTGTSNIAEFLCVDDVFFKIMIEKTGPNLKSLSVHGWYEPPVELNNCSSLRKLIWKACPMDFDLHAMLRPCSGNLCELQMSGQRLAKNHTSAISQHCANLRKLSLAYSESSECGLHDIWATVGPTLEYLTFRGPFWVKQDGNWKGMRINIEEIARFCKTVDHLDVQFSEVHEMYIIRLCKLFGPQLTSLGLRKMWETPVDFFVQCASTINDTCRVDVSVNSSKAAEVLPFLGPRAREVSLTEKFAPRCEFAGAHISKVEKIEFFCSDRLFENAIHFPLGFLATPKPYLRSLVFGNKPLSPSELNLLAQQVQSIEEIRLWLWQASVGAFRNFANANPVLHSVKICYCGSYRYHEDVAVKVVDGLAGSKALKVLEIYFDNGTTVPVQHKKSDKINRALHRGRQLDGFIYGFQYYG